MTDFPLSYWFADAPPAPPRPPLTGDARADVAIVGAGYTGMWTALYLKAARPDLDVRLIEARHAGFGASGRNGGWLTGGMAWDPALLAAQHGDGPTRAFIAALRDTVPEVIAQARARGIDADILETRELTVAFTLPQLNRLRAEVAARRGWGEEIALLDAAQTAARIRLPGALGATDLGGVARVQPAKLAQGLARVLDVLGVPIHEGTRARRLRPGAVETDRGTLSAPIILRCTEGYTAGLPGQGRTWLPLNSSQIVTEPLTAAQWDAIGWQGADLLGTADNLFAYCQRTVDGRIALGARGQPYRYGSGIDWDARQDASTVARLTAMRDRLFPVLRGAPVAAAWGGVLAAPRDWCPSVGLDPATGLGWAGGYVGVGVSTSNLAGRTLADLALGRDTPLTLLPWVGRQSPKWEPEPIRWLAVRGMHHLFTASDAAEARSGRPSRLGDLGRWLTGR